MDNKPVTPAPLVHTGFAHSRTQVSNGAIDTQREKAFVKAWIEANPPASPYGKQPILHALVPQCQGRDAQVAATMVQWLGSQVGFHFLSEALACAGYEIKKTQERGFE